MTTRPYQFPQETKESTGAGPDFPGSSGDRERGRFRPSSIPRRTTVAVSGDGGLPVAMTTDELLGELLLWQKAIALGLSFMSERVDAQGNAVKFTVEDLLSEASRL